MALAVSCRIAVRQPSLDVYDAPCGSVLITALEPGTPIEYVLGILRLLVDVSGTFDDPVRLTAWI
jgi:hypothetical protein